MQQTTSQYDYPFTYRWLEKKGKEMYGSKFMLHNQDAVLQKLVCWFLRDEALAKKLKLNLQKGILLTGPVGCGKTTLMSLLRYLLPDANRHIVKTCRNISFEFIAEGFSVIHKYTTGGLYQYHPRIFCFDDLGTESSLKYYGNQCNVMAEILLTRYDLFINHQLITHLTTNLSATEIENTYGNRVRSRMRDMFNLIAFENNSPDKRT